MHNNLLMHTLHINKNRASIGGGCEARTRDKRIKSASFALCTRSKPYKT